MAAILSHTIKNSAVTDGFFNPGDDPAQQTLIARRRSAQENQDFITGASAAIPAVLASMIDTFGTSLGLLDDEEVKNWLNQYATSVAGFSAAHSGGVGLAGDIVGTFLPAGLAIKAVRSATMIKALNKTIGPKFAKFLTSTGKTNQQLSEEFLARSKTLEQVNKGVRRLDQSGAPFNVRRAMIGRSVNDVVVENIAADIVIAASMHSSDFLFPDEMELVDHLLFFGAANALFSGGAFATAKFAFNRTANRVLGAAGAKAQNPGGVPITEILGRADTRGIGITIRGHKLRDIIDERHAAPVAGDRTVLDVADASRAALQVGLKDDFIRLGKDSPIQNVTKRVSFNNESRNI